MLVHNNEEVDEVLYNTEFIQQAIPEDYREYFVYTLIEVCNDLTTQLLQLGVPDVRCIHNISMLDLTIEV